MYRSPYETTPCRNHRIDDIRNQLQQMELEGDLVRVRDRVRLVGDEHKDLKPFAHPLVMDNKVSGEEVLIVGDSRASARRDRTSGELKGGSDFNFLKMRCALMDVAWVDGNTRDLLNTGDIQMTMFARLMAENLGRRMNLDLEAQLSVQIISAYYFLGLFYEYDEMPTDENDLIGYAKRISRSLKMTVPRVMDVLNKVSPMQSITEYVTTLIEHAGSVRLEKLKPALLYTMLGGIWFGANANETVAVSLEHPPTFSAMLYMVATERGYRKTVLGQLLKQVDRRGDQAEEFVKRVERLVSND